MIDRFCTRCRETVTRDQVECPFCGNETMPLDEGYAWTAPSGHYPPYVNMTGRVLTIRGKAKRIETGVSDRAYWAPGDSAQIELLPDTMAELAAVMNAIAAAASQGGDVKQAPGEAPQSGGDSRIAQPKGAA